MKRLPSVDPTRFGGWIQTFTGACFWPLDPRPEEISIVDIAHALSNLCRYAGHTQRFYSVAEHSVLVSRYVSKANALWGLLHDAPEAYSADIPRPLKRYLREWEPIEARLMEAVCERFGLPFGEPEDVYFVDKSITADERIALMAPCVRDWGDRPQPVGALIRALSPKDAKIAFMERYYQIVDGRL